MISKFFKLFSKKEAEEVTEIGREVISRVTKDVDEYIAKSTPVEPKEKKEVYRKKHFRYRTDFSEGEGVSIKTEHVPKYGSKTHIIVVLREDGRKLPKPKLKWVDDRYCGEIKNCDISGYPKHYFNLNSWDLVKCSLK